MSENVLDEKIEKEFTDFMETQKKKLRQIIIDEADAILSICYTNYGMWIASDAWMNYREHLRMQMQGGLYKQVLDTTEGHWAKNVRDMIFMEHKEALVEALNKDLLDKIALLQDELKRSYERRY